MSILLRIATLMLIMASTTHGYLSFMRPIPVTDTAPIKRLYTGNTEKLALMNYAIKSISSVGIPSGIESIAMSPTAQINTAVLSAPTIAGRVLNYPNPFKKSDGTTLFYTLSETGTVDIAIFDMMAHQVVKATRLAGLPGATVGQNRIALSDLGVNSNDLSAGVYFFVITHNGKVIGKGKMAVI